MSKRFRDRGQHIHQFSSPRLVYCPRCAACATLTVAANERRIVCGGCGYNRTINVTSTPHRQPPGPIEIRLWLETPCCGETLWAYNAAHLDFLEEYVSADLREGPSADATTTLRNSTLASRLPAWIKSAKNRAEVLRCIARLRERLGG